MQRILWKGAISFGLVHIPVQLFPAESRHQLDFDMLDKRDFAPIGYKRINKETGKEVEWKNIVKAYEYESDQYVVMTDEDLKRANVKATRSIDILAFVDAQRVSPIYYEQPYFLTPEKGGDKVYALLRETLRRSQKVGIAQIVMRSRQHLVALIPIDDMIVLNTLRYADEIRSAEEFNVPKLSLKQAGISEKELQMALALVDGMTEEWDASQYHDTYREDVLAMVQRKIKANQAKTITAPDADETAEPKTAKIIDLMALLKQSMSTKEGAAAPAAGLKRAPHTRKTARTATGAIAGKRAVKTSTRSKSRSATASPGAKAVKKTAAPRRTRA
jgi:DNA end-binding protein Ku